MGRTITTSDIARHAGVSRATVDRVLNGRDGVRPHTAQLVNEAAETLRRKNFDLGAPATIKSTRRIATILPKGPNPFVNNFANRIREHAHKELEVAVFRSASFRATDAIYSLNTLGDGFDAIVLVAPDVPAVNEAVRRRRSAGGLVVALASPIAAADFYVGLDNRAAGRIAGQLVSRFVRPSEGIVALVIGNHSYRGQEEREVGFRAVLAHERNELGIKTVISDEVDDMSYEEACDALIEETPDLVAIYNTGSGNLGLARSLEKHSKQEIVLVGHDLTEPTRGLLLSGIMDALVSQSAAQEADAVIEAIRGRYDSNDLTLIQHRLMTSQIILRESLGQD